MAEVGRATRKTGAGVEEKTKTGKGGRKGGTIFPRLTLKQALEYSKKLVSKTAVASQPEATVLAGVFNNAGPEGKIRLSALKQFGLLEGKAAGYKAAQVARDIEGAANEGAKKHLIQRAMLAPKVYRELFNTYQGDQASKAKIRGRVQQLGVHPDLSETCADLFISSAVTATLATVDGDGVRLVGAPKQAQSGAPGTEEFNGRATAAEASLTPVGATVAKNQEERADETGETLPATGNGDDTGPPAPRPRMAADVAVNLTVDSSLDGDKLERQLALLRRYGLI
jgi:hypothetical protein